METHLKIEYLAPYLPYGLKVINMRGKIFLLNTFSNILGDGIESREIQTVLSDKMKPILRPLSDLTKGDLDYLLNHHSTDWFADTDFENIIIKCLEHKNLHNFIEFLPFGLVLWFIENHYDVFRLIEQNLAIDINTLNK